MKAKIKEKKKCIALRKKGWSLNDISKEVGVAKSSVSTWVRDVDLTNDQIEVLKYKRKASASNSETFRKRRKEYQQKGRDRVQKEDALYAFGCALFWGEGNKKKNIVRITNSDATMLKFFVSFLKKYFDVKPEEMGISVQYYLNGELELKDIEEYWCNTLDLPKTSLKSHTLKSKYYTNENIKHPYGICSISVFDTEIAMQIFGSIKEYINDKSEDRWLF